MPNYQARQAHMQDPADMHRARTRAMGLIWHEQEGGPNPVHMGPGSKSDACGVMARARVGW